jgi:hypothetical protein
MGMPEFAMGDFCSAQQAFRNALSINPADVTSRKHLELAEQILALDPNSRGLNTSEKYARSRKLIESIIGSLDQCLATETNPLPPSATEIVDAARRSLLYRGRSHSYGDAAEANVALSEQLWKARIDSCGPPGGSDEMLPILMARLSKWRFGASHAGVPSAQMSAGVFPEEVAFGIFQRFSPDDVSSRCSPRSHYLHHSTMPRGKIPSTI